MENYKNFDPVTGKKLNPTCEFCWVKKIKKFNCGHEQCPGWKLIVEDYKEGKSTINEMRKKNGLEPLMAEVADKKLMLPKE